MHLNPIETRYNDIIKNSVFLKMKAKPTFVLSDSFKFHLCPSHDMITAIFVVSFNEISFSKKMNENGYFLKKNLNDVVDDHFEKCRKAIKLLKSAVKQITAFQMELLLTFNAVNDLQSCILNVIVYMDDILQMYEVRIDVDNYLKHQYFYVSSDKDKNFFMKEVNSDFIDHYFIIEFIKQKLTILSLDTDIDIESISINHIDEYLNLISMQTV